MRRNLNFARGAGQLALTAFAVLYAFPLYIIVTLSLKTEAEGARAPFSLPSGLFGGNFDRAWATSATSGNASLAPAFVNSILITLVGVALLVLTGALGGYVLARRRSRLADALFVLFLLGLTVPQQLGIVPLFQLARSLGLVGTAGGMVLIYAGLLAPLTIFLYTTFIRALPTDYEEAALMDGASRLRVFWDVVLPLVRPVTATVVVIQGIHIWNDFFTPIIFLLGSGQQTLPVAIFSLVGEYATAWGPIFAGVVIASAPAMAVFVFLQRHVVRGFSGGIK